MNNIAQEVKALLRQKGLTVGTVESATGGLMAHLITNVTGISRYYQGSVVSYSNEIKVRVIGVKDETIKRFGAVSSQVAEEMAAGGRKFLGVDICVADTGLAGPSGGTPDKPVGLFYISLSHKGGTFSRKHNFSGNREQNKQQAAEAALGWLKEYLLTC